MLITKRQNRKINKNSGRIKHFQQNSNIRELIGEKEKNIHYSKQPRKLKKTR